MPGFNVSNFRANGLIQGGFRPSLFTVTLTFPSLVATPGVSERVQFLARASSLPASVIDQIEVPYFGRKIKLEGNRTFEDWEVTIMMDEDMQLRNAFEAWHNSINTIISNRLDPRVADTIPNFGNSYKTTALVTAFKKEGPGDIDGEGAIRTYKFDGIWPTVVSDVGLDWENVNQIGQFSVRFA